MRKTTIALSDDELAATQFIRRVRPDLLSDASVRRTAIVKLAIELGWDRRQSDK